MKRFPWNANHGSEQPCRILIYDTETFAVEHDRSPGRFSHSLRLGVAQLWQRDGLAWSKTRHWRFSRREIFWHGLYDCCRAREPLWVYAHNASFDAAIVDLWKELTDGNIVLKDAGREYIDQKSGVTRKSKDWHGRLAVDNLPFIVEARCSRGSIKFVDTMNYIPVGLDKIAKWVGMKKVPIPKQTDSEPEWYARCERDVEITAACVMKLLGLWSGRKLGTWQMTIAGLAYSCFRHLAPDNGIVAHGDEAATPDEMASDWIQHRTPSMDAKDISRMERNAYYGARVMVGYQGDIMPAEWCAATDDAELERRTRPAVTGPMTCFDANGMYAYAMRAYEYPIEYLGQELAPDVDMAFDLASNHPCIGHVKINSSVGCYPYRRDGRTVFVRGSFQTTLAGPELVAAFQRGHVDQVHSLVVYHGSRPFVQYVDYWCEIRERAIAEGDECTAKLAKGMYTGLFGKLGQRRPQWVVDPTIPCPHAWGPFIFNPGDGRGYLRCRAVAGVAQVQGERRDCRHTFTAAAAFVASWARVMMDNVRAALPAKSVVYQDTDSLFCLPAATERLHAAGMIHPTALGKLKELGVYQFSSIFGSKNYRRNGVDTVAGKSTISVAEGERRWRQEYFERCNSIIGRGPDGTVQQWNAIFAPAATAAGCIVAEDGWTTPELVYD